MEFGRYARFVFLVGSGPLVGLGFCPSIGHAQSAENAAYVPSIDGETQAAPVLSASDGPKESLLKLHAAARDAFSKQRWVEASERFRQVSATCVGSPLALESNYFAMLSDWRRKDIGCAATVTKWLAEAKSLQRRRQDAKVPSASSMDGSMDGWIANAQLILAQNERRANAGAAAEARLKALLQLDETERDPDQAWPEQLPAAGSVWLELGLLRTESKRDPHGALHCLQQAIELSQGVNETQCSAWAAMARCHLDCGEMEAAAQAIEQLQQHADREDWRIRTALLRHDLEKIQSNLVSAAESLRPAIQWALAGRADIALVYELAVALLAAHVDADGEALLVEIVHRDPNSPLAVDARIRLAKQAYGRGEWDEVRKSLDDAIALGCPGYLAPHAYFMRGKAKIELQLPQSARDDFVLALQFTTDDVQLDTAVRFELAEALVLLQLWDQARPHWEMLAKRALSNEGPPPSWLATIWLRQAEEQALQKDWMAAEQSVYRIREQFPECDRRDEVDYLLARCWISKAQFDSARQLLQAIASKPQVQSPEIAARAWWMMGETYLMQRRYGEAVQSYEQVFRVDARAYWQSAAWMQIGQCQELLQDASAARHAYEQIVRSDADGTFGALARERLEKLPPSARETEPSAKTSSNDGLGSNKR